MYTLYFARWYIVINLHILCFLKYFVYFTWQWNLCSYSRHGNEQCPVQAAWWWTVPIRVWWGCPSPSCPSSSIKSVWIGQSASSNEQSRHPKTAGRAFYVCNWNDLMNPCHCLFFQWIDGPDKFDHRIRLFPYYRSESWAYNEFRRWIPPPPNPPPMTEEEKHEAAIYRVNNPPKCHCGVRAKLQRPNIGVPPKFTPFFRCSLKTRVSVM